MSLVNLPNNFLNAPIFTWSSRPPAAGWNNVVIKISDVGTNGSYWQSTGTRWFPCSGEVTLYHSHTAVVLTGTTSETTLVQYTVPAGLMSSKGILEIFHLWEYPSNANTKTVNIRLNSLSGAMYCNIAATTTVDTQNYVCIRANNSTSAQKGGNSTLTTGLGLSNAPIQTSSVDTTVDLPIYVTGQLAVGTNTITYRGIKISYRE